MKADKLKKCKICTEEKPLTEYYKNGKYYRPYCKSCLLTYNKEHKDNSKVYKYPKYHAKRYAGSDGYVKFMYAGIKKRIMNCSRYKNMKLGFNFADFADFVKTTSFLELYKHFVSEGRPRKLAPSVDRIDNSRGYIPGNIQIITQSENASKGSK